MNARRAQGNIVRYSASAAKRQFGQQCDESRAGAFWGRTVGLPPQLNLNWFRGLGRGGPAGIDRLEKSGLGASGEGEISVPEEIVPAAIRPKAGSHLAQKEA
jgi:hypothetical protein